MERGKDGLVSIDSDVVAQVLNYSLRRNVASERIITSGANGIVAHEPTIEDCSGTIEAKMLQADAGQDKLVAGAKVNLDLRRLGTGSGLPSAKVTALVQTVEERWDPSVYNQVTFTWVGGAVDDTVQV